jgi:hypothetical protein
LQQRLATSKDNITVVASATRCLPSKLNLRSQIWSGLKFSATIAIRTNKVSIAKLAHRIGAILFASTPQIASCKTAKNRCTASVCTLALQGSEKFFYAIH